MNAKERERFYLESYQSAQKEAADALQARDDAQHRLNMANEALAAWKTIAAQAGLTLTSDDSEKPVAQPKRIHIQTPDGVIPVPVRDGLTKTEFVRLMVQTSGTHGVSPAEIKEAAIEAGFDVYVGYPHSVLSKLKEQGIVEARADGKYVVPTFAKK